MNKKIFLICLFGLLSRPAQSAINLSSVADIANNSSLNNNFYVLNEGEFNVATPIDINLDSINSLEIKNNTDLSINKHNLSGSKLKLTNLTISGGSVNVSGGLVSTSSGLSTNSLTINNGSIIATGAAN